MAERVISLNDEDGALLDRLVEEGGYLSEAEALHESLKLAALARTSDALREAALNAAIQVGLDDVEAGRVTILRSAAELSAFLKNISE